MRTIMSRGLEIVTRFAEIIKYLKNKNIKNKKKLI